MHHLYFIRGLSPLKYFPYRTIPIKSGYLFDRSNQEKFKIIEDVTRICLMHKNIRNNSFIRSLAKEIEKSLDDGHQVTIMGHSYGGFISNQVIKQIHTHPRSHTMNVYTFGSIQIIDPKRYAHINIIQLMTLGDMATRCIRHVSPKNLEYKEVDIHTIDGKTIKIYISQQKRITWIRPSMSDWFGVRNHFDYPIKEITAGNIFF